MANGLDKLERLFSTKRKAASSRNTAAAGSNNIYTSSTPSSPQAQSPPSSSSQVAPRLPLQLQVQLPESPPLSFPPTPFIRPNKANASSMQPRNEFRLSNSHSVLMSAVARADSISSGSLRLSRTFSVSSQDHHHHHHHQHHRHNSVNSNKDRMASGHHRHQSAYSTATTTSSLLSRRHDRHPAGLAQLQLPGDTAHNFNDSTQQTGAASLPSHQPEQPLPVLAPQKRLLEALPIYPLAATSTSRVETPPPSDQDDFQLPCSSLPQTERGRNHIQHSTSVIQHHQLTPEPSPDMFPRRDSSLAGPKLSGEIERCSPPPIPLSRRVTASSVPLLDDDWRDSYLPEPEEPEPEPELEPVSPNSKIVFHEPPVADFLALTDDDLAEVKPSYPSKPPTKRAPPPPILPPGTRSAATTPTTTTAMISPTIRSPVPATPITAHKEVAAWEAARIAKKFDFDVVYVANFWPTDMNFLHSPRRQPSSTPNSFTFGSSPSTTATAAAAAPPTTPLSPRCPPPPPPPADLFASSSRSSSSTSSSPSSRDCCPNSGHPSSPNSPLSASLLAAYGLETIRAPFRLGAAVHRKILRTEGWIEHRNASAAPHEFARGYARAFYRGQPPRPPLPTRRRSRRSSWCGEKKEHEEKAVNRGIVFVAYRRPRGPDGAVNSSAAELDALEKEAETLVELILDFHLERRRLEMAQQGTRRASE